MLHTEVVFLDLTIYYSIQKWKLFVRARLLFNITTILTKKVLNYFEVMINYIIAVTLHVRRNNVMPFFSYHLLFSQMILLPSWIHIGLILYSQPLLNSNTLHQARCVWYTLDPVCSCHDVSPQFSSGKARPVFKSSSYPMFF